jgi:hypothetical protein
MDHAVVLQLAERFHRLRVFVEALAVLRGRCCAPALACAADAVTSALDHIRLPAARVRPTPQPNGIGVAPLSLGRLDRAGQPAGRRAASATIMRRASC